MPAYYNEIDKNAAAWLRELINQGLLAAGDVDERDIRDIEPRELRGYTQCHFFAGIGGWGHALRLAGWADDRPVWTGSCPCQPFSAAGARGGVADERHLWPHWHHLINECRPAVVFGEQVASKDGLGWLDLVQADMEGSGYAVGAADLCAAGVGAPHIRQRLWFVGLADAGSAGQFSTAHAGIHRSEESAGSRNGEPERSGDGSGLSDADNEQQSAAGNNARSGDAGRHSFGGGLADANGRNTSTEWQQRLGEQRFQPQDGDIRLGPDTYGSNMGDGSYEDIKRPRPTNGLWRDADWLLCRDGKWRAVEPGTFPLAHGIPARVGRLRGYGNAIVPSVAATFIRSVMDITG